MSLPERDPDMWHVVEEQPARNERGWLLPSFRIETATGTVLARGQVVLARYE